MATIVDARGRSCPEPVVLTQQALSDKTVKELTVIVDVAVARENVARFIQNTTGKQPKVKETAANEWEITVKL